MAIKKNIDMKVTFIIPVYNVEDYVENCIQSVLNSWRKEKEIFLVLGKSEDDSNLICEKYSKCYSEVKIIYQNGKGLSNARNCALKYATGEYVLFVDSDDYLDSKALQTRLELLFNMDERPDILASDFIAISDGGEKIRESNNIRAYELIKTGGTVIQEYLSSAGGVWNVWRYIYRLAFIRDCGFIFEENMRCEDVLFTIKAFGRAKICAFLSKPYYYYRMRRKGALTTHIDISYVTEFLTILELGYRELDCYCNKEVAQLLRRKLEREYVFGLPYAYEVERSTRIETRDLYQKYSWLLKNSNNIIYKLLGKWISKIGVALPAFVLYVIRENRRK